MKATRIVSVVVVSLVAGLLWWDGPSFLAADEKDAQQAEKSEKKSDAIPDRELLEKQFEEKMSGVALVGHFSVDGQENNTGKPERYEIKEVRKLRDDLWVFQARIKYGQVDATIPLTLKVLWAGDTPMISLTDFTIPGMGTFTSRVIFYQDRYAGTWQHDAVGGQMWGRIEKLTDEDQTKEKSPTEQE